MNDRKFHTYETKTDVIRFLLGGIGTGNISVGARGQFTDFEIFGTPNKGMASPYTFFAISTRSESGESIVKALEGEIPPPYPRSHGFNAWDIGGLPRLRKSVLSSRYPFVNVNLEDEDIPVTVRLEAFTPFIPLESDDSGIPGAIVRYYVKNISDQKQTVSIAGSFANLCNYAGRDIWSKPLFKGESINQYVNRDKVRGLHFTSADKSMADVDYMEMALLTTERSGISYREYWNEGAWWDGLQDFWNDFAEDGQLDTVRTLKGKGNRNHVSDLKSGSLCVQKALVAGEETVFEFILSWYRPNRIRSWKQNQDIKETKRKLIKNHHARFGGAINAAEYLVENLERLERDSRLFADALYGSTLPVDVIEAVANTITVIRSNTCFQVEGGRFFAYEGCFDNAGCCEGSCTHVWNYAQTLAFLFPDLERSMRQTEFLEETDDNGNMRFRAHTYMEDKRTTRYPAADGQLGCVIRLYRDWKLCGDKEYLKALWPNAKKALEFAYKEWDSDGDGMLDSKQHNTYDIEFFGPNSMTNSIWFAALEAGARMAEYLGDAGSAEKYRQTAKTAGNLVDELLFREEYYVQDIADVNVWKYQYGIGCLSDQLFGQTLSHMNGLGYVLNPENVKKAIYSVFKYNFKEQLRSHCNLQRTYALNGESGLVLCTWPHGGRPDIPFTYSDEVWSGIEYHVAAHLIYEGFVEEGLKIVSAVRNRHDGVKRSPWNEVECGHHYARSLSSWMVLLALSGYHCDMPNKKLTFEPQINRDDFSCFFSSGTAWGVFRQKLDPVTGKYIKTVDVLHGTLNGIEVC